MLDNSTASPLAIGGMRIWDDDTKEQVSPTTGSFAVRTFHCDWSNRWTIAALLTTPSLTVPVPGAYPDATWLICETVSMEGVPVRGDGSADDSHPSDPSPKFVGANSMVAFRYAKLTCRYAPFVNQTIVVDHGFETFMIEDGTFKFRSDDTDVLAGVFPGLFFAVQSIRVSQPNRLTIPAGLDSLLRKVNSDTLHFRATVGGIVTDVTPAKDPGTVILKGATSQSVNSSGGNVYQKLDLLFEWKENGWNQFYRSDADAFDAVYNVATGNPPYVSAALSSLLI